MGPENRGHPLVRIMTGRNFIVPRALVLWELDRASAWSLCRAFPGVLYDVPPDEPSFWPVHRGVVQPNNGSALHWGDATAPRPGDTEAAYWFAQTFTPAGFLPHCLWDQPTPALLKDLLDASGALHVPLEESAHMVARALQSGVALGTLDWLWHFGLSPAGRTFVLKHLVHGQMYDNVIAGATADQVRIMPPGIRFLWERLRAAAEQPGVGPGRASRGIAFALVAGGHGADVVGWWLDNVRRAGAEDFAGDPRADRWRSPADYELYEAAVAHGNMDVLCGLPPRPPHERPSIWWHWHRMAAGRPCCACGPAGAVTRHVLLHHGPVPEPAMLDTLLAGFCCHDPDCASNILDGLVWGSCQGWQGPAHPVAFILDRLSHRGDVSTFARAHFAAVE